MNSKNVPPPSFIKKLSSNNSNPSLAKKLSSNANKKTSDLSYLKKLSSNGLQKTQNALHDVKDRLIIIYNNPWFWWIVLYIVLAVVISYLTVMTTKYLATKCLDKRGWFNYIFRFCFSDVCKTPPSQVVNNIHIMSEIEGKPKNHNIPPPPHLNKTDPAVTYDIKDLEEPEQVFHIGNQEYTYEQAKCKCASYKAKLANYSQMVEAYNKGADWCSYGWSDGQTAYYPTQKCNWIKKTKEEREKCGKPGINGGFFADPYLKFGVNCFGKKPEGKVVKLKHKDCKSNYCEMPQNYYASHRLPTDEIAPFNEDKWSA